VVVIKQNTHHSLWLTLVWCGHTLVMDHKHWEIVTLLKSGIFNITITTIINVDELYHYHVSDVTLSVYPHRAG
jgi:hypothetical protein